MHKAILINPSELAVSEITVPDHYTSIQDVIGCRCFTCVRIDKQNVAYVDDEGLINGTKFGTIFDKGFYPDPIAGNILILGDDGKGGSCDTNLHTDDVDMMISSFVQFRNGGSA
jgi:hypothetical protein